MMPKYPPTSSAVAAGGRAPLPQRVQHRQGLGAQCERGLEALVGRLRHRTQDKLRNRRVDLRVDRARIRDRLGQHLGGDGEGPVAFERLAAGDQGVDVVTNAYAIHKNRLSCPNSCGGQ